MMTQCGTGKHETNGNVLVYIAGVVCSPSPKNRIAERKIGNIREHNKLKTVGNLLLHVLNKI